MLKPKKGFVQAHLNIDKLSPLQWDGIMRAMDAYTEHYYKYKVNELNLRSVEVHQYPCDTCSGYEQGYDPCKYCLVCKRMIEI